MSQILKLGSASVVAFALAAAGAAFARADDSAPPATTTSTTPTVPTASTSTPESTGWQIRTMVYKSGSCGKGAKDCGPWVGAAVTLFRNGKPVAHDRTDMKGRTKPMFCPAGAGYSFTISGSWHGRHMTFRQKLGAAMKGIVIPYGLSVSGH
jgi:hypothetical protein